MTSLCSCSCQRQDKFPFHFLCLFKPVVTDIQSVTLIRPLCSVMTGFTDHAKGTAVFNVPVTSIVPGVPPTTTFLNTT